MVIHQRVFVDATEDITTSNVVSDIEVSRVKVPFNLSAEGFSVDTACVRCQYGAQTIELSNLRGI